ncbi:MAG: riboflavin biosynthesis protein RibD [Planctomycetota bacterium]
MSRIAEFDAQMMRRALRLAARGQGSVEPNPMVGCVLVRSGRVVGEGWHKRFGGPHAEVFALRSAGAAARGATAYVTLEPCCYHGKTPACTDALIKAGVSRVVAAMTDPNPRVRGRGAKLLRAAGIDVELGLLREEAETLNAPFTKLVKTGRPWVILKWAQSLDGAIATASGDSKWISDEACRAHAHKTRGRVDAIVVGVNTVLRDDPELTCRVGRPRRVAVRVVLDSKLRTPMRSKLVRTARETPTWIVTTAAAAKPAVSRLEKAGCRIVRVGKQRDSVDPAALLDHIGESGFANVLVEGGAQVHGAFLSRGLADEVHIYTAPILIPGRDALRPIGGDSLDRVRDATSLRIVEQRHIGSYTFTRGLL